MSAPDISDAEDDSVVDAVDLTEDHEWQDAENDEEQLTFVSLFDDRVFPRFIDMLDYCRDHHQFDLSQVVAQLGVYVSIAQYQASRGAH